MPKNTALASYDMIIDMYDMQDEGISKGFIDYENPIALECRARLAKSTVWSGTTWYYSDNDTLIVEFKPESARYIKGTSRFGNVRSKQGEWTGRVDDFTPWDTNTAITQHKVYIVQKVLPILNSRGLVESVEYQMVSTSIPDEEYNRGLNAYLAQNSPNATGNQGQ